MTGRSVQLIRFAASFTSADEVRIPALGKHASFNE